LTTRHTSLLVLLLALLSTTCGLDTSNTAATAGRRFRSLRLESTGTRSDTENIERYRALRPGPDVAWRTVDGEARLVELEGGDAHALVINFEVQSKLIIPGPFDGRAFNAVAVEIEYDQQREFVLEFISRGDLSSVSGLAHSDAVAGRQVLHFSLPSLYTPPEQIGRLRLRCTSTVKDLRLLSVDLLRKPLSQRLPIPESGPELIRIGSEDRQGVGMDTEHGIGSRYLVEAGAELRFSYAAPGNSEDGDRTPTLQLNLGTEDGRSESHFFSPKGSAEYSWHDVRVPLEDYAGEELEFSWKVTAPTPAPWALAEVGILEGEGPATRVLLITSDTHRADHLSLGGENLNARTPNLDRLAQRGTVFSDCFTTTNVTNPSHIALMTGTHPRDTGILENNEPMSRAAGTLAEVFRNAGFATFASVSVQHLGDSLSGLGQGFDRYAAPHIAGIKDARETIDTMLAWVDDQEDVPVFLWLHLFDAHVPYAPPSKILAAYYDTRAAAFDPDAPAPEGLPSRVYDSIFPGLKDLDYPLALYAGEVTYLDRELSRVFDHPTLGNAVVAFTADHGESLGHHGIYYAHADLYPDSIHVPLILTYPGGPAGGRIDDPVRQTDIGRTLLDLAGLVGVEFPGNSLLDSSAASTGMPRFAIGASQELASITHEGWHLILALTDVSGHYRVEGRPKHEVTLFHLPSDPETTTNRVETDFERARELRRQLLEWLSEAQDQGWRGERITDAKTLRSLEALGYTASTEDTPETIEFFDFDCVCEWCARFEDLDAR
jgi:arylsulfatase A-like enzyme